MHKIYRIATREAERMWRNPIYFCCMVLFPIMVIFYFTSLMDEGQPLEMPVGVVDQDQSTTTRKLVRKLDAFQTTRIAGTYHSVAEARKAMQRNEIYAFIYFPPEFTSDLTASRQPTLSYYYSNTSITAGSLLFRDLKTISTLVGAGVGQTKLAAIGKTSDEIRAFLQPVRVDLHALNNPQVNYSYYLSTSLVPACLLLFIFLVTAYSIGTELKYRTAKKWIEMADGHISIALVGKLIPQTLIYLTIMLGFQYYIYGIHLFPMMGNFWDVMLLSTLSVLAAQGFGVFIFGLLPSVRMSMSICALWAALSFTLMGSTYPTSAMSPAVATLSNLFPMRHYFMIYQICVFNGFPLTDAWWHIAALIVFIALPLLTMSRLKGAVLTWEYIE